MERVAEGLRKVPGDLPEQGRRYDAQHLGDVARRAMQQRADFLAERRGQRVILARNLLGTRLRR
ncbi:hypothetical protein [Burkholderia sp. PR2]|uniref:hypothetical protein n=1 Tax=Burkholderia sp. PR2 TaxID=3448078 RepID=UPI00402AFD49